MDLNQFVWPPWLQTALGGLGLIWCLKTLIKLRTRPPWAPGLVPTTAIFTAVSAVLMALGLWRWVTG